MVEYVVAGGPVMIPILLCSVIGLAAFFERMWALRRDRVVPRSFAVELTELARQRRWNDAVTLCRKRDVVAARVALSAIDARGHDRPIIKERLEEVGRREAADLERFIPVLGTVASIAPLLGLLGTVGGMIVTFQVIQTEGLGNVGSLAGGISQALITTFAGLCVGIPAVVGNRYLLSRVDSLLLDLEEVGLALLAELHGERDDGATEAATT